MPSQFFACHDVLKMINREISRIERYDQGDQERFTVMFVAFDEHYKPEMMDLLHANLRMSDMIYMRGGGAILILSNTERMGALHVDKLIKDFSEKHFEALMVSYPEDGLDAEELIRKIKMMEDGKLASDVTLFLNP